MKAKDLKGKSKWTKARRIAHSKAMKASYVARKKNQGPSFDDENEKFLEYEDDPVKPSWKTERVEGIADEEISGDPTDMLYVKIEDSVHTLFSLLSKNRRISIIKELLDTFVD